MNKKIGMLLLTAAAWLPAASMDGEQVYRNNCTRCHIVMPAFSAKMTRVIVRHMRVRATLTQSEAEAVRSFLNERSGTVSAKPR